MAIHHVKASFKQTVFIKPEGEKFCSTKSIEVSLSDISLRTEKVIPLGTKVDLEISMLDATTAVPIKVSGIVSKHTVEGLVVSFEKMEDYDIERLEQVIMHNTSHPYEFEEEIHELDKDDDTPLEYLPKAN